MPSIELIYDRDCPNIAGARRRLVEALSQAGRPLQWQEWRRDDPAAPSYVTQYGSPTILVGGQDIEPGNSGSNSCRLYAQPDGNVSCVPPLATIISALKPAGHAGFDWRTGRAWIPAAGIAFLPKVVCPACWPAYAAAVSALGLSFLTQVQYLLPLTAMALFFLLLLLGWQARSRHGYGPLLLALFAGTGLLAGKFYYDSITMTYTSGSLLLIACLWHSWSPATASGRSCPRCVDDNPEVKEES